MATMVMLPQVQTIMNYTSNLLEVEQKYGALEQFVTNVDRMNIKWLP